MALATRAASSDVFNLEPALCGGVDVPRKTINLEAPHSIIPAALHRLPPDNWNAVSTPSAANPSR